MYVCDVISDADPFNLDAKMSADGKQDPAVAKSDKKVDLDEDGEEFSEEMKNFDASKFEDDFIRAGNVGSYGCVV